MFRRRLPRIPVSVKYLIVASLVVWLTSPLAARAADGHRVLILDVGRWPNGVVGSDHHRLMLVEIDTGKIRAEADLARDTSLALSPKGDIVAALSWAQGSDRLNIYRSSDLKRLESGRLPASIPRCHYQLGAALDCRLSPDGKELLIQGPGPTRGNPGQLGDTSLNCVKREVDEDGVCKRAGTTVAVPRSHSVQFVRVADWPRVHIWKYYLGLLEVVDVNSGKIVSRLPLGDDPILKTIDPADLNKADIKLIPRLTGNGCVVADGGRYAYYVPHHPYDPGKPIGFLRKIDLSVDPPKVVRQGKAPEAQLWGRGPACEAAGTLFVVKASVGPPAARGNPRSLSIQPSRWVRLFSTTELEFKGEIELPFVCDQLEVSRDGKYLYALDSKHAKLAVIDAGTRKEVKVLDSLGTYPHLMMALPELNGEK